MGLQAVPRVALVTESGGASAYCYLSLLLTMVTSSRRTIAAPR